MGAWPLWRLRTPALIYYLAIHIVAVALVFLVVATTPAPRSGPLLTFAMLAVTAGLVIVGTSVSIYRRHGIRSNPWTVHVCYLTAGMMTLPPNLLVLLLIGPALHGILDKRAGLYRWTFTTAATLLAVFSARSTLGWHEPQWEPRRIMLACVVLLVVRCALVGAGWRLQNPDAPREEVLGEPIDSLLAVVAACLGGMLGVAVTAVPGSALLAGPPMALLDFASQLPQYRRSAQRDGKTGLANANHWERLARSELRRARARRQPVSVLLLDLDHFKRVNDQVGHIAGDTVLAAVALMLSSSVRQADIVGRFGGEEFVVLLPGADPEIACTVAHRVRLSTESLSVPARDTRGRQHELNDITVSIGVATTLRYGYELNELVVAADAALLAAKSSGRNAVTVA